MNFRIVWLSAAEQALGAAFLAARAVGEVRAFNVAVRQAEAALTDDPEQAGESRTVGTGERLLVVPPAVIEFEVFPLDRVAVVSHVRYASLRRHT